MIEVGMGHIAGVLGSLAGCVGVLWRVIDHYADRERQRNDRNEKELKETREKVVNLSIEVAEVKGSVVGQRLVTEKVLGRIEELVTNGDTGCS